MAGDRAVRQAPARRGRGHHDGLDDYPATIALLQARALNGLFDGDLDTVRSASSEGARLSRETGDLYSLEMMLINLGLAALIGGDLDESKPLFTEALRIAQPDRRPGGAVLPARRVGLPRRRFRPGRGSRPNCSGRPRPCKRASAQPSCHTSLHSWPRPKNRRRAALGAHTFEAEFEAGQRLSRDDRDRPGARRARSRSAAASRRYPDGAARETGSRGRTAGRRRPEQQADRSAPAHLRAHRRQPRPQHPEQTRIQLTRPDRRLDCVTQPVADARSTT